LTSTGRQRASFIELENNSDEDESDVENPLGGDSDNESTKTINKNRMSN
jgi:hypothetical protein